MLLQLLLNIDAKTTRKTKGKYIIYLLVVIKESAELSSGNNKLTMKTET